MTINCLGKLVNLESPKVLGILNVTPDSFYDGGTLKSDNDILKRTEKMLDEGATFIDIGGYSSRPGATDIEIKEETQRVLPVVKALKKEFPNSIISIDTFRSAVAEVALSEGAAIINDISGGSLDANMMQTVAKHQVPYIMMHMKGTPQTMKSLAQYENVTQEVIFYFSQKIAEARSHGIHDLIIDAGFGFAKNIDHNFELLKNLDKLQLLEVPVLTGISRKSMIYKTLNIPASEALNGTSALHMIALQNGSQILRVHDVKEAVECIKLYEALN